MREHFAEQLVELEQRVIERIETAVSTLATIASAVQDATARQIAVIAQDGEILREHARLAHSDLLVLVARQTPVASDLRLLMALIDITDRTGLIANQFTLISDQLSLTSPTVLDRLAAGEKLAEMCVLAGAQLQRATTAFRDRDLATARQVETDDDQVDRLNREIFETAAQAELPGPERELSMHHVLIGRCLERIADNAVDLGEQAAFVITGHVQEFSDASEPRRPGS